VPPRPSLPADDLYARLEISVDASPEVIEVAWRSLLRRHHPDVAGAEGLEHSKRINVAHDWLSDPGLRDRYDRERGLRRSIRDSAGRRPRDHDPGPDRPTATVRDRRTARRPADPAEALARFLDRVAVLGPDEIDRLSCSTSAPIAFGAMVSRFLPPDRLAALESMSTSIDARLAPEAAANPGVHAAVVGYGTELVLGSFLDELLTEPFRERTRERLTRGWEAAIDQPRYGPNGAAVLAWIDRLGQLDGPDVTALAATATQLSADEPWPTGTSPEDDEALRVSSVLAARDAAAAIPSGSAATATVSRARRSAQRLAHILVLRHAFAPPVYASLTRPWRPRFLSPDAAGPRVRQRRPSD
jgi:DnaJ domain